MSTPTEHDTEALARVILPALPNHCCPPAAVTDCPYNAHEASGVAEVVLASDWLAAHDAALIAKAKAEGWGRGYAMGLVTVSSGAIWQSPPNPYRAAVIESRTVSAYCPEGCPDADACVVGHPCQRHGSAPESQPLTEEEMTRLHNAGFACPDHFPAGTIGRRHADDVLRAVETILATRTAALRDRLKAAERERDLAFAAMTNASDLVRITDINSLLAHAKTTAEADKARAVAETRVALLDQVERLLKAERDKHYVFGSRLGRCHDADLAIVRALREEVSGQ